MDIDIKRFGEDIEDFLLKIEKSFGVKFADNDFVHIKTFGEESQNLCERCSGKNPYKKRVDGKTFEEVEWNEKNIYRDKNHFYEYSKRKLKKDQYTGFVYMVEAVIGI